MQDNSDCPRLADKTMVLGPSGDVSGHSKTTTTHTHSAKTATEQYPTLPCEGPSVLSGPNQGFQGVDSYCLSLTNWATLRIFSVLLSRLGLKTPYILLHHGRQCRHGPYRGKGP